MFDGPGTSSDIAAALALDTAGNAYVAGYTTFPPQNRDYAAVKYAAADGAEEWSIHYPGPFGTNDGVFDIAVSGTGDVFLTGHVYDPSNQEEAVTLGYRQVAPSSVEDSLDPEWLHGLAGDIGVRKLWLAGNPVVGGDASLRFELSRPSRVHISLHDARGRIVATPHHGWASALMKPGPHLIAWGDLAGRVLASGMYYLRLQTDRGSASMPVTVIR